MSDKKDGISESQKVFLSGQRLRLNEARSTLVTFRMLYGHMAEFAPITEAIRVYLRDVVLTKEA